MKITAKLLNKMPKGDALNLVGEALATAEGQARLDLENLLDDLMTSEVDPEELEPEDEELAQLYYGEMADID